jgi:serine/threonine protein kinase
MANPRDPSPKTPPVRRGRVSQDDLPETQDADWSSDALPSLNSPSVKSSRMEDYSYPDIEGYVIQAELGHGGQGRVFKALDLAVREPVAIKVLSPNARWSRVARERFDREIKTYHRLRDGHLIQPRSHGTIVQGEFKDCPYVVMEYMDGGTLEQWMRHEGAHSKEHLRGTIRILVEVCKGLEYLHQHGVIHRDLKPQNVLLAEISNESEGTPFPRQIRLSDFGLVTSLGNAPSLSVTGMGVGTPAYMSPEQFVDAKNITPASDQYSMGVMLYQALCQRRPWQADANIPEERGIIEARAHSKSIPPDPTQWVRRVDRQLKEICMRCLEPLPPDRYDHVRHLRQSLEAWLEGDIDPHTRSWLKRFWRQRISRPIRRAPSLFLATWIGAILIFTLSLGVLNYYAFHRPSVSYYDDVVERWGVFEGRDPLSLGEVQQRPHSFRLTRKGWLGRVIRAERINGALRPVEFPYLFVTSFNWGMHFEEDVPYNAIGHQETRYEYEYSSDQLIKQVTACSALNTPLWRLHYESPHRVRWVDLTSFETLETVGILNPGASGQKQRIFSIDHTDEGWLKSIVDWHWGADGQLSAGETAGRGLIHTHDLRGRILKRGRFQRVEQGISVRLLYEIEYHDDSRVIYSSFDAAGRAHKKQRVTLDSLERIDNVSSWIRPSSTADTWKPGSGLYGEHIMQYSYDSFGNLSSLKYLDSQKNLMANYRDIAIIEMEHDRQGRKIEERYQGSFEEWVADPDGNYGRTWIYDDQNRTVNQGPISITGKPLGPRQKLWRNREGRTIRIELLDSANNPSANRSGVHRIDGVINADGFIEQIIYSDEKLKRTSDERGISRIDRGPEATGRVRWQKYYDAEDHPTRLPDGEYGQRNTYDEYGRLALVTFLGPNGEAQNNDSGFAFRQNVWEFDEQRWFDESHNQVVPTVQISDVVANSVADQIGLKSGDVILDYDSNPISQPDHLSTLVQGVSSTYTTIRYLRGSLKKTSRIKPGPLGVKLRQTFTPIKELVISDQTQAATVEEEIADWVKGWSKARDSMFRGINQVIRGLTGT